MVYAFDYLLFLLLIELSFNLYAHLLSRVIAKNYSLARVHTLLITTILRSKGIQRLVVYAVRP